MRIYLRCAIIALLSLATGYELGIRRRIFLNNAIVTVQPPAQDEHERPLKLTNCFYDRRRELWVPYELIEA